MALELRASLLRPVINATGVIAHTNLGRSPVEMHLPPRAQNLEFDLGTGQRGSRQTGIGALIARAVGAEAAIVVNNNAAAVLLVLAALAQGRDVAVSRGESVEIGGSFRVPEVMEQSGARLVDVGTTNRTRVGDYRKAIERKGNDVALVLKVHPSNFRMVGFTAEADLGALAAHAPMTDAGLIMRAIRPHSFWASHVSDLAVLPDTQVETRGDIDRVTGYVLRIRMNVRSSL